TATLLQMQPRRRCAPAAGAAAALLLALAPRDAGAQDAPAGAPPLSPEELAEIERALASDADAQEAAGQTPAKNRLALPAPAPGSTAAAFLPDIALILDLALAAFSDEDRRLQTDGHDPSANGFNLQQLEMSLGKSVDPYLRFDANIVFSQMGVEIEEAVATTLAMP